MVGGSQEEALNRFSKLLQPIRDLAQNWDIDIAGEWGPRALLPPCGGRAARDPASRAARGPAWARGSRLRGFFRVVPDGARGPRLAPASVPPGGAQVRTSGCWFPRPSGPTPSPPGPAEDLDGYLEELQSFQIDVGNDQTLNFAEAALVIQGSAHVYGRKVDYLRALAQEAHDFVFERKGKGKRGARRGGPVVEGDGGEPDPWDAEENFLALDDLVEEADGCDLDDEDAGEGAGEAGGAAAHQGREMPAILSLIGAGAEETDGAAPRIASFAVHG